MLSGQDIPKDRQRRQGVEGGDIPASRDKTDDQPLTPVMK